MVRPGWNGFNVIHDSASRVAALDLGFVPSASARIAPPPKFVYLLGADDWADAEVPEGAFVVYQVRHVGVSAYYHVGSMCGLEC